MLSPAIFFLSLVVLTHSAEDRYAFLLPNSTGNHRWERIEPADLSCPVYNNVELSLPDQIQAVEMVIHVPVGYRDKLIQGHICQKIQSTAYCHEHWFFGRDITYETRQVVVSLDECIYEMTRPSSAFRVTPPTPQCSYFTDEEASRESISITQMDVHYDPYRNSYVSPILVGGSCKDSPCRASFGRALWIPVKKAETTCELERRTVWVENTTSGLIYHSALHPPKTGSVCRMAFCGKEGVRFSDGEWFYMPNYMAVTNGAERCVNKTVSSYSATSEAAEATYMDDLVKSSRCYDSISRIRATGSVSPWDLSIFTPDRPGPAYGYRMRDGILERSLLQYVITAARRMQNDQIGVDAWGSPVFWDDWISEGPANQTWHGPNGLVLSRLKSGKLNLLLPHEAMRQSRLNRAYSKPTEIESHFESPPEDLDEPLFDHRFKDHKHSFKALGWTHLLVQSPVTWVIIGLVVLVPVVRRLLICLWTGPKRMPVAGYLGAYRPGDFELHSV